MDVKLVEQFINNTGCVFVGYNKNHPTKYDIVCRSCRGVYVQSYRDFRQQKKYQCIRCTMCQNAVVRRNTTADVSKFLNLHQCDLVGDYKNSHTVMTLQCGCKNLFKRTLSDARSIIRNNRSLICPTCSRKKQTFQQTFTLDQVRVFIMSTGCTLLSSSYSSYTDPLNIECRVCKKSFVNTLKDFKNNGTYACSRCTCANVSIQEKALGDWIQSTHNLSLVRNDRTILGGKELDILIPSHQLAIEYNGVHYHTDYYGRGRLYHSAKRLECVGKNYALLQINDVDWIQKPDICKSIISSKLGRNAKIFARKCEIRRVYDNIIIQQFLVDNHLQGQDKSTIAFGLYYRNVLVQLITFCKPRFTTSYHYEISRLCTVINHTVVGGASKLFKQFVKTVDPISVITYADLRYATGSVYTTMGFRHIRDSAPGYSYERNGRLFNRMNFQKHKLIAQLGIDNVDMCKSESINMANNRYNKLWDCGVRVYEWSAKQ